MFFLLSDAASRRLLRFPSGLNPRLHKVGKKPEMEAKIDITYGVVSAVKLRERKWLVTTAICAALYVGMIAGLAFLGGYAH